MRFLHTSDWHLGIQLHNAPLLEEQRALVALLAKAVEQTQAEAVVIAGDIFDHAVPSPEAIRLYSEMMRILCAECGVPVLICAGNHDGAARLSVCAPLLRGAGLFVAGRLSDGVEPIVLGDTAFFLLPYFNLEEARYLYPTQDLKSVSEGMRVVCRELLEKAPAGKKQVLVAHCFAAGGEAGESDRAAVLGTAGRVALDVFEGFDYVALGHLHRSQQFVHGKTVVRYSGTPYPYSFGELGEKSFTYVDTTTMKIETIPVPPPRPVRVLEGAFDTLLQQARYDTGKGDYLKIILTDCPMGLWRMAQLREHYENLLVLEGILTENNQGNMSVKELQKLQPEDLVRRFCDECGNLVLDDELMEIFREAATFDEEEQNV